MLRQKNKEYGKNVGTSYFYFSPTNVQRKEESLQLQVKETLQQNQSLEKCIDQLKAVRPKFSVREGTCFTLP
jgi:hypothetical protein